MLSLLRVSFRRFPDPHRPSLEVDRYQFLRRGIEVRVCQQIDRGGTTIGIDVERFFRTPVTELTRRASRTLELRAKEMQGLTLRTNDPDRVKSKDALRWKMGIDLRPLWLTAYGYEVLSTMGLGF